MAPEILHGDADPGASQDIYAFGVLAWELLAGREPFRLPAHLTPEQRMARLLERVGEGIGPIPAPGVPGWMQVVVDRCTRARPRERPRSMQEVMAWIDRALEELDGGPGPEPGLLPAAGDTIRVEDPEGSTWWSRLLGRVRGGPGDTVRVPDPPPSAPPPAADRSGEGWSPPDPAERWALRGLALAGWAAAVAGGLLLLASWSGSAFHEAARALLGREPVAAVWEGLVLGAGGTGLALLADLLRKRRLAARCWAASRRDLWASMHRVVRQEVERLASELPGDLAEAGSRAGALDLAGKLYLQLVHGLDEDAILDLEEAWHRVERGQPAAGDLDRCLRHLLVALALRGATERRRWVVWHGPLRRMTRAVLAGFARAHPMDRVKDFRRRVQWLARALMDGSGGPRIRRLR